MAQPRRATTAPATRTTRAAHIYRALPDGSQLERVITGGMNNPVGLAFSETGERFLSGTFFDLSKPGRRDGILHAVYGGTYGRENPRDQRRVHETSIAIPGFARLSGLAIREERSTAREMWHELVTSGILL